MATYKIDAEALKRQASGKWLEIFRRYSALAPALRKVGNHVTCPVHQSKSGDHGNGFRLFKDANVTGGGVCNTCGTRANGLQLLQWLTDQSFLEVLNEVNDYLNVGGFNASPVIQAPIVIDQKSIEITDQVKKMHLNASYWDSIDGSAPGAALLRKYLASRGLSYIPKGLRFHPNMIYTRDDESKVNLPAMLGMVQAPDGSGVTIHRTYLDPETGKKAAVERPKMLMSKPSTKSMKGAAIRLATVYGDVMGVAEGIETSIAAIEATGIPVWATVAAHFMEQFMPPDHVKRVIIFADKDLSNTGQSSAQKLVERLWAMDVKASIELPPSLIPEGAKGIDWLDEWNLHGKLNFPKAA